MYEGFVGLMLVFRGYKGSFGVYKGFYGVHEGDLGFRGFL